MVKSHSDPGIDALIALASERGGRVLGVSVATVPANADAEAKPSKYRNVRCSFDGRKFDSKAEMAYAIELKRRLDAGEIHDVQYQPRFTLGVAECIYKADFMIYFLDGSVEAVDYKGSWTRKFARDVKLWRRFGPCRLRIVSRSGADRVVEGKPIKGRTHER